MITLWFLVIEQSSLPPTSVCSPVSPTVKPRKPMLQRRDYAGCVISDFRVFLGIQLYIVLRSIVQRLLSFGFPRLSAFGVLS